MLNDTQETSIGSFARNRSTKLLFTGELHEHLADIEATRIDNIRQLDCDSPAIANLITLYGYNDLCELLSLGNAVFSEVYPELHLDFKERRQLKARVKEHYKVCECCREMAENHNWVDGVLQRLLELAITNQPTGCESLHALSADGWKNELMLCSSSV